MTFIDDERAQRLVALAAEPPLVAGRFELGARLGEGGMGVVFEAWDRETQRCVALKLLTAVDEATSARFGREAAALALLSHPGIVGHVAHGAGAEGERYLAMERLVGVTLAERLARGPLGVRDTARVGHGIAAALAAAHGHGLVHRDIKPSNVFLEDGDVERVKLLDFGLARSQGASAVTHAGSLVGTPSYMAPEQVRGTSHADPRVDLFALGAVLFECLSGRAAFVGADTEALLLKILIEQPPSIRAFCPSAPPAFEALIVQLLSADPAQRPRGATEVARELEAWLVEPYADTSPALAAGDPAQPGALIAGKYRVLRALGSGGMGIVLLARHETLDRQVAIKLVRGGGKSGGGEARLVREARAASRLESDHVARVMDVGMLDDGAPFIVMEYLSGKDLAQLLVEKKRLPVGVAVDYVLQAGEALAEAHALGIVHRDLKPSNLFLTTRRDGSPLIKVLDFGISKLFSTSRAGSSELVPSEASITAPDAVLGSPLYMAPEQLQGAARVDAGTDIWALGVVLQQLVTGRPPFEADSVMAIAAKIAAGAPADLRAACPDAPAGLGAVVRRCLEKDPARRFRSIGELAQALRPYAPEQARASIERISRIVGGTTEAPPGPMARDGDTAGDGAPVARRLRRRGLLVAGAVAALALVVARLAPWRAPLASEGTGTASDEGVRGAAAERTILGGASAEGERSRDTSRDSRSRDSTRRDSTSRDSTSRDSTPVVVTSGTPSPVSPSGAGSLHADNAPSGAATSATPSSRVSARRTPAQPPLGFDSTSPPRRAPASDGGSSGAPARAPSVAPARRPAAAGKNDRAAAPALGRSRAPERSPSDTLDPMNPALLDR